MTAPVAFAQECFRSTRWGASTLLWIQSEFQTEPIASALVAGETQLRRQYELTQVRSGGSARVFRFAITVGGTEQTVYFKEYLARSVWDVLKHTLRASRAKRAVKASLMLGAEGFLAPGILAFGERRAFVITKSCFLATWEVSEAKPVYMLLVEDLGIDQSVALLHARRDLIRTLGEAIGRLHRRGIVHGDLRSGNILARQEHGCWQVFFLDNERTRRWPWLPVRLRLKNLVQANMIAQGVTTTDRFRFFRAYLSACPGLRPCYKWWARKIQARTLERRDKYRRRGHMVRV